MGDGHPERDIIPYLRGELTGPDRGPVERHLAACADCRGAAEGYRALLEELARSIPAAPVLHPGRYRAEVRERIDRGARRAAAAWRWSLRTVPVALSAALVGVLVMIAAQGGGLRAVGKREAIALEELMLGRRLGLLQRYEVVERLDLLEDFEVIQHLDGLSTTSES
jgi:anti-sigma factor RsiW